MAHFKKIQDELMFYIGEDSSGDPLTVAKAAINRFYFQVLRAVKQDTIRRDDFTLTTRASASKYGLPIYVRDVLNIEDPDNDKRLVETSASDYDRQFPGTSDAGDPDLYYTIGEYGVQRQPASTGTITVVSSATGDQTNRYVNVRGFNSSGDMFPPEQLTLNGITAVTSSNSYKVSTGIQRLIKTTEDGYTIDGNITVKDSDSNTLAVIPTWEISPSYKWIEFHFIPDSAITYNLRTLERKMPLVENEDWPEIDPDFHDLLLYGPASELLPKFGQLEMATNFAGMFSKRLREFKNVYSPRPNREHIFADVSLEVGWPSRPLIRGVDIGLAV